MRRRTWLMSITLLCNKNVQNTFCYSKFLIEIANNSVVQNRYIDNLFLARIILMCKFVCVYMCEYKCVATNNIEGLRTLEFANILFKFSHTYK